MVTTCEERERNGPYQDAVVTRAYAFPRPSRETGTYSATHGETKLSLGGSIHDSPIRWPANGLSRCGCAVVAGISGGEVEGVLITGVYGAGKSSVAEEIADALEARGALFGAIDLDWLMWFGVPGLEPETSDGSS